MPVHRFADLRDMLARAEDLRARGYRSKGKWSLGQTCRHLAGFMEMSRRGFHGVKIPFVAKLLKRPLLWYILNRGFPKGAPAPPLLIPGDHGSDEEGIALLRREVEAYEAHAGPLAPSPLFGPLSRERWTELHLRHAEHHFGFLEPKS